MFDPIVAISSGLVNQPISIIRLSGPEVFQVVAKVFTGKVGKDKTVTYGFIKNVEGHKIDEVLVSWFRGPNSFTGEDLVEIGAHGGVINTNTILKTFLSLGVRLAEPGEFSKRAFWNGKMDLVKAEAIHDLIFAKTEEQARASVQKFGGETSSLIKQLKTKILKIIATCEANIDYPEYDDMEVLTTQNLLPKLKEVRKSLQEIQEVSKSSKFIFKGISVAIVGKPNVGKSSLLNALVSEEKSIVTSVPGTTRDVIESQVQIGQHLFNFMDTAGIRQTHSHVEKIGVQKAWEKVLQADLIIHLKDSLDKDFVDEKLVFHKTQAPVIVVFNKNDLQKYDHKLVSISAKNNHIGSLIKAIKREFQNVNLDDSKIISNTRQLALINSCALNIKSAIENLENNQTPDVVIVDIQQAWNDLANVLGQASNEDLLDQMFKNFCLGK